MVRAGIVIEGQVLQERDNHPSNKSVLLATRYFMEPLLSIWWYRYIETIGDRSQNSLHSVSIGKLRMHSQLVLHNMGRAKWKSLTLDSFGAGDDTSTNAARY